MAIESIYEDISHKNLHFSIFLVLSIPFLSKLNTRKRFSHSPNILRSKSRVWILGPRLTLVESFLNKLSLPSFRNHSTPTTISLSPLISSLTTLTLFSKEKPTMGIYFWEMNMVGALLFRLRKAAPLLLEPGMKELFLFLNFLGAIVIYFLE